jgi:ABC-2 type transport system ATP-binding protein
VTSVLTENLTKDFPVGFWRPRPHRALDTLSFEIPSGVVFGLLGPNGAGKSTTLKLLLDLLRPTAGRAEVLGRPPGDTDARRRLGFLPEQPAFYDQLTAEELLRYFAGLFGYEREERKQRAARMLDLVGLGAERRRPLRQYSKGMLQRVGLAQALVSDPELVILDEPMSGLDPLGRREVRELILRLRDEGRTILFSSHILSDAEALCSRVGILSKGKLVASGAVDELTSGAGRASGWEVVVVGLTESAAGAPQTGARRATRIADGRYAFELGSDVPIESFIARIAAAGGSIASVTPLRATLEDVFVRHVAASTEHPAPSTGEPRP